MKHIKLLEDSNNKIIYTISINSDFFGFLEMEKVDMAFTSIEDAKNFVINFTNDLYDKLKKDNLLSEDEEKYELETYKNCQDFFKNIHNDDGLTSNYTFKVDKFQLLENVDTPEIHKMKKDSDRYNI